MGTCRHRVRTTGPPKLGISHFGGEAASSPYPGDAELAFQVSSRQHVASGSIPPSSCKAGNAKKSPKTGAKEQLGRCPALEGQHGSWGGMGLSHIPESHGTG